jgi:hypothetical protein
MSGNVDDPTALTEMRKLINNEFNACQKRLDDMVSRGDISAEQRALRVVGCQNRYDRDIGAINDRQAELNRYYAENPHMPRFSGGRRRRQRSTRRRRSMRRRRSTRRR